MSLIPEAQASELSLRFGRMDDTSPAAQQYLELLNPNPVAVDVSGYQLGGPVQLTLAPGESLYHLEQQECMQPWPASSVCACTKRCVCWVTRQDSVAWSLLLWPQYGSSPWPADSRLTRRVQGRCWRLAAP